MGIYQKAETLHAAVGAQRFWKGFWFVLGDIIVGALIFLLLDGLRGLSFYGSAFGIAVISNGVAYAIQDSESASSDSALVIVASLAYGISYLAIVAILVAPVIGIIMFFGVKYGGWELFWR